MVSFKRQLIISFLIIIASVGVATAALYFFSGDITVQIQKIQADRELIDQDTGALITISGLKNQLPQAEMYEAAIDQLLPTQDGLIGFNDWINKIAAGHQVAATITFTNSSIPGTGLSESVFTFEIDGPLPNAIAFLKDVESQSAGFLIQISDLNIVTNGGSYRLTGHGLVFYR